MIGPIYEKLSEAHPNVTFAKVDIDENGDAAEQAAIRVSSPMRSVVYVGLVGCALYYTYRSLSVSGCLSVCLRWQSVPTFMFWKDGAFAGQFSGADEATLKTCLTQIDE